MIGPPLSETETDSPVAVLTTWPEMNPPPMSANGGRFDLLARQAFAAGHRDADAVLRLGQEIVAPLRHREAKASGLVRGGEGLAPIRRPAGP